MSTKPVVVILDFNTSSSAGKTNLPSFPPIFSPSSLSGLWRPKVMVNSVVLIDVTFSSGTLEASTASPSKLMIFMEVETKFFPCKKKK